MKHADMGGNHHGASSRDYLTCRVVGYDRDNLFIEHPWTLRPMRIPTADFPNHLQEHITNLKEVVRDGNGTAELRLQADDPRLRLVSDFHAGDPESVARLTDSLHKAMEYMICGGPMSPYANPNPWFGHGDLLPTTQEEPPRTVRCVTNWSVGSDDVPDWVRNIPQQNTEEAPGMNLYSVTLIDAYNKIVIDTKVVAKNDEAAKLAAGVYGWLQGNGRTFDDVTVCVGALCRVRERMTGPGE